VLIFVLVVIFLLVGSSDGGGGGLGPLGSNRFVYLHFIPDVGGVI
jgi:hypothetical protein